MDANPHIGACQPKLLAYARRDTFEYAGAAGGGMDILGYPFARGRIFETCEPDRGQYDTTIPISWASGAALFIRANAYHEVGGLDPFFFAHQEEIDLCWRLSASEYEIYVCPDSKVFHVGGGTLPKGNRWMVMLNYRNNLLLLLKNMPLHLLWWVFPFRYLLDVVAAYRELLHGNGAYWRAIVQAHMQVWGWLPSPAPKGAVAREKSPPRGGDLPRKHRLGLLCTKGKELDLFPENYSTRGIVTLAFLPYFCPENLKAICRQIRTADPEFIETKQKGSSLKEQYG